jgi:MFS transporter, DHA1 family, multidrug resistance protein B
VKAFSQHRNLRVRIGVGFVNRLLDSMITTFMAIYLAGHYGIAIAGLLMLAVASVGVAAMLAGGHMADTWGRRPTLLLAELVACASYAVMAAGDASDAAVVVYAGYLTGKIASSIALPANDALIVDVTTPQDRKQAYTVIYWATNLALACGSLTGGFLYNGHFTLLLGIAAAATAGVWVSTFGFISETKPATDPEPAGRRHPWRELGLGYRIVTGDRAFLRLVVAATLGLAIEFQLASYVGVRLSTQFPAQNLLGIGTWVLHVNAVKMVGILRAENTTLVVLLALFSRRLFRRVPDKLRLYAGIGMFVAGYMVLAVSNAGGVLLVAGLVLTVGELMNVPVKQSLLADIVPTEARPRYMAIYNLSIRVSQMIASFCITLGALLRPYGMAGLYAVFGVVIVLQYRALLSRSPRAAKAAEQGTSVPSRAAIGR